MADWGDSLERGYETGLELAASAGVTADPAATAEARALLQQLIGEVRDEVDDVEAFYRFVELFSGLTAIASAARSFYEEEPLSLDTLRAYLEDSRRFLNSYSGWHP